jgi:Ca-activated chloride channel family protein
MKLAYEVAARGFVSGGANRVVLMSDGVANLGAATAQEILVSVDQYRKQGIYLTVLGFGSGNYDDAMLMQLADKGDGAYSFVDSDEEAKRLLVDQWEQTLNVIAKDVKIQIEFNPDRVKRWRQIGYEKRHLTKQDFRNDAVDAGEVGSGQSVTALYDIELDRSGDIPVPDFGHRNVSATPIATMRVRYKDPDTGKVTELEQRITDANRHANFASAPVRFRAAACAAEFAELLRVSPYTAGSDFAAVIEQLRPVAGELTLDQRVQELLRMAERARGLAK